jgi:hypothetical protein
MTTNFVNLITPLQANYVQGENIELRVYLTSNHGGKFMFRICPRQTNLDEACFGTNYLVRCAPSTGNKHALLLLLLLDSWLAWVCQGCYSFL